MKRRRLQKKPRMQPVLHDSVVNSYVFDLSELDTKPFFLLPRNCIHCYSSAKKCISNRKSLITQICGNKFFIYFELPGKNNAVEDIFSFFTVFAKTVMH